MHVTRVEEWMNGGLTLFGYGERGAVVEGAPEMRMRGFTVIEAAGNTATRTTASPPV